MMGVLLMLIGITFVTVGCDQANKAGGNSSNGDVTNGNNQNNNGNNQNNNEITGVWEILEMGGHKYPRKLTGQGVPAGAKQYMYIFLTTDRKIIQAAKITGWPTGDVLSQSPQKGTYKLLGENKAEIDLGGGAGTYSYTLSGSMLKIADLQLEAKSMIHFYHSILYTHNYD